MWSNPLKHRICTGITNDSDSFKNINWDQCFEIPVGAHCGAFSAVRKHDIHKGIDLYATVDTDVYAVETGKIVDIRQFTGDALGFPWWNDTWAISVEGDTGVVVYGEIDVHSELKVGNYVEAGSSLGTVLEVLKKYKGRPMSMLHLALHRHGVLRNGRWDVGAPQPVGLLDPTHHLLKGLV